MNLYHLSDLTIYAISFYASANLVHLLEFKYLACSTSFERRDVSFGWFCGGLFVAQKNIPHDISVPKKGDTYPKINIPNDYEAYPAVLLANCIQLSSSRFTGVCEQETRRTFSCSNKAAIALPTICPCNVTCEAVNLIFNI